MKTNKLIAAVAAFLMTTGAFAQTTAPAPGQDVHKAHIKPTPDKVAEFRAERRAEMKEKIAKMTPEERKAFREARKQKMQERLNAMTPEQREKFKEQWRQRKEQRKQEQSGK